MFLKSDLFLIVHFFKVHSYLKASYQMYQEFDIFIKVLSLKEIDKIVITVS